MPEIKHYVSRTVTENPGYMQADIKVPAGVTLHAGQVVVAETLDATIPDNYRVYAPTQVADATKENVAIILNGGFEELPDGRLPAGQPDYTQYSFNEGAVVTAHRLLPEVRFEISVDACDATVAAASIVPGDNLVPKNGQYELTYSAKADAVTAKDYLTIEAVRYFQLGGQFGSNMAKVLVVRAKHTDSAAA